MITKQKLDAIRADLTAAFATIAKTHGLSALDIGAIKYDSKGSFRATLEGTEQGGLTKEAQYYNQMRAYKGGLPELGAVLQLGRPASPHKIVGANTTGTKVLCEDGAGREWLFRTEDIVRAAARQNIPGTAGPDFRSVCVGAPS